MGLGRSQGGEGTTANLTVNPYTPAQAAPHRYLLVICLGWVGEDILIAKSMGCRGLERSSSDSHFQLHAFLVPTIVQDNLALSGQRKLTDNYLIHLV